MGVILPPRHQASQTLAEGLAIARQGDSYVSTSQNEARKAWLPAT